MTLKLKSEAWNEIALHMNAAGYNRSKERLKQQLGRIRTAETKRIKEEMEKSLPVVSNGSNTSGDKRGMHEVMILQVYNKDEETFQSPPRPAQHALPIKAERIVSTDDDSNVEELNCQSQQSERVSMVNDDDGTSSGFVQQSVMRLMLQNIQSLSEISKATTNNNSATVKISPAKADFTSALPDASNTGTMHSKGQIMESKCHNVHCQEENVENDKKIPSSGVLQKKRRTRSSRVTGLRTEQRLRQIHLYRVAVERERLRALKIQQKRDRILHRKDLQIQNLKLEILRNITNQTRDVNRINF